MAMTEVFALMRRERGLEVAAGYAAHVVVAPFPEEEEQIVRVLRQKMIFDEAGDEIIAATENPSFRQTPRL